MITIGIDPHKGSHTATAVDEHEAVVGELRVNAGGCRPPSARDRADAELVGVIKAIHGRSLGTYGAPRIHAELAMAFATRCGRKRVARLMRSAAIEGVHRRRRGGLTIRDPTPHRRPKRADDPFRRAAMVRPRCRALRDRWLRPDQAILLQWPVVDDGDLPAGPAHDEEATVGAVVARAPRRRADAIGGRGCCVVPQPRPSGAGAAVVTIRVPLVDVRLRVGRQRRCVARAGGTAEELPLRLPGVAVV